ncbi:hypothetical protein SAMN00768000_3612 [Sulfobacillus thermosulfidooxidans DSM 9293]|uniref:Uncharacterized protein n=1 Tax=Sulfobacillus thermosulfidooxidans (strain DSM 9293 / VKM B-1269 / AT-1) TaxID=929705 RepID=A0A1W1WPA7_SULTA|nr:hypothetical protein [Sulfobacillus thermosulfidooxidans]SMC08042.1 hypothetical protein SAMN00768000_3612 [Sulfobacillus thermosulfidooxidans DSM 9293]
MINSPDNGLQHQITFLPGYDGRHPDPAHNQGVDGMEIRFTVSGPKGLVYFALDTQWYPLSAVQDHYDPTRWAEQPYQARSLEIGYHACVPQHPYHRAHPDCDFLAGQSCYSEIFYRSARSLYWVFVHEGEPAIWRELEHHYHQLKGRG